MSELTLDPHRTVKDQFGWLPTSVYRPPSGSEWDELIGDELDVANTDKGIGVGDSQKFSTFNPNMAEVIVRYWSNPGDRVVDPFSGRSTRAVVTCALGRHYEGYEVVQETADRTRERAQLFAQEHGVTATVHLADGVCMANTMDSSADLVFTCPPYQQVERYKSVPGQLSDIKDYTLFENTICLAATHIYRVLKPGRFAVWVVADWRRDGKLVLFHKDSIDAFEHAGFVTHDIIIMENISPYTSKLAATAAARRFTAKTHEYVLVFRKP